MKSFIGASIEVEFDSDPFLEKKPHCPDRFVWEETTFIVSEVLSTWVDYRRRGRRASNMRPENLRMAAQRGSWGVGRYYFRVAVAGGRAFELYYDRSPTGGQRKGQWFLAHEMHAPSQ